MNINFTFLNFGVATLASGIASGATSATLASGSSGLFDSASGSAPIRAVIWNSTDYSNPFLDPSHELFDITAASGPAITTMAGAKESTTAANHNTAGKTYKMAAVVTAAFFNALVKLLSGTGTARLNTTTGNLQLTPDSGSNWYNLSAENQGGALVPVLAQTADNS